MGYYIELPIKKGKAEQLVKLYGARIIPSAPSLKDVKPDEAVICVVDNFNWEAAGFAYDEAELNAFKAPDVLQGASLVADTAVTAVTAVIDLNPIRQRPRTWLLMDRKVACKLTGFNEEEHRHIMGEYR